LLQADIFPQKLVAPVRVVIFAAHREWLVPAPERSAAPAASVSAISRSSPKFGSDTITPSISSPCERKRSAQRRASATFHRTELTFLGRQAVRLVALLAEHAQDLLAPVARQHVREKSPVTDD